MRARILFATTMVIGLAFACSRAEPPAVPLSGERDRDLKSIDAFAKELRPQKKTEDKAPAKSDKKVGPLARRDLDARLAEIANTATTLGTELWRTEDYNGTYRLYQGTILGILPLLDHRPKLHNYVEKQLKAAVAMDLDRGAFVLREALDVIQKETSGEGILEKGVLWDRLGGEKNVKLIVHDLIAAAIKDPKVNFSRDGKHKLTEKLVARIEEHFVELISDFSAGPLTYYGRDVQRTVHAGMHITGAEYDAFVGHLADALKKNKVADSDAKELLRKVRDMKILLVGK